MRTTARATVAAGIIVAFGAVALPASGAWSTPSGTGDGTAKALAAVGVPTSVTAEPTTAAPDNSITISWQAPTSGPTPTSYRVDRTSPAASDICPSPTLTAGTYTCNDTGRTSGTSYEYKVYALVQLWSSIEVSRSATPVTATTTVYLRNSATDVASVRQAWMPMNTTAATQAATNDFDNDGIAGRRIDKGGVAPTGEVAEPVKHMTWRYTSPATTYNGTATLNFYASYKAASGSATGYRFRAYARVQTNSSTSNPAWSAVCGTGDLSTATSLSGAAWTKITATLPMNCTVGNAGRWLEIVLVLDGGAADDARIGYASVPQQSWIALP